MKKKNFFYLLFTSAIKAGLLMIILGLNFSPSFVMAAAAGSDQTAIQPVNQYLAWQIEPLKIKINLPVPGLEDFSSEQGVEVNRDNVVKYIGGIYKFFVGIAGIITVFMIVFGGVIWLFSGGNAEKISKAKDYITGALIGLLLVVGSYTILATINPALVNFTNFDIPKVEFNTFPEDGSICDSEALVIPIPAIDKITISGNCSDPRLLPETIDKLKVAASLLDNNESLVITSAYRSYQKQNELYNCYKQGLCPNIAAKPSCSAPHQTGKAVDVCIKTNNQDTCQYITTICNGGCPGAYMLNTNQTRLQTIMKQAGFSRYCGEWWHFESETMSSSCNPGQYTTPGIQTKY